MEHLLGQEWEIVPAGGATGEAFIAQHDKQRLFLKRNSSPFLAVLSAEGIVPKLVWTKRLENGDVISAQQWLSGRVLEPTEMNDLRVARLLQKIHRSEPLLGMLKRLGKSPLLPQELLNMIDDELDQDIRNLPIILSSMEFLKKELVNVYCEDMVVCHCDVNHNNWLITDTNELYLIDWDGAMIADPAIDLGMLLHWYIPQEEWQGWVNRYGIELTDQLVIRMKWYVIAQTITSIQWHKSKARFEEMNKWVKYLNDTL